MTPRTYRLSTCLVAVLLATLGVAIAAEPPADNSQQQLLPENGPTEADYPTLHHLLQVSDLIYSGAEPVGEDAFAELKRLGVKTIVCVDGARPNVEGAAEQGLRYIHIPIGYNGIGTEAGRALARVVQEAEGPIYFHCHHGRHRGPAAAAAACIATGVADNMSAQRIMQKAGTSLGYPGLWRDVQQYQPPAPGEPLPELVSVAKVDSLSAAMAQADRSFDLLALSKEAGWTVPEDHPDLVPANEARVTSQALQEARGHSQDLDGPILGWMDQSVAIADRLTEALSVGNRAAADELFGQLETSCKSCHKVYRDGEAPN